MADSSCDSNTTKQISVVVPEEDYRKLEEMAKEELTSKSQLVRKIVHDALEARGAK